MSTPDLSRLQEIFAAAVTSAARASDGVAVLNGSPDRIMARLSIYRGNSVANAHGALANAYPIVAKIVGSEFFEGLAREYWRGNPARSGDLNVYGERFADFIADFPHTQDLPYLPDVARMEWLVHRAYYAADPPPLLADALARLSGGESHGLQPIVAPACALFASTWPLARLWQIHQEDYEGEFSVDWNGGGDRILVYRPQFRPLVAALPPVRMLFSGRS